MPKWVEAAWMACFHPTGLPSQLGTTAGARCPHQHRSAAWWTWPEGAWDRWVPSKAASWRSSRGRNMRWNVLGWCWQTGAHHTAQKWLFVVSWMDRQHLARSTAGMLNLWLCNLRKDLPPGPTTGEHQIRLQNVSMQPATLLCLNKLVTNYILSSLGRDHHFGLCHVLCHVLCFFFSDTVILEIIMLSL